MCPFLCLPLTRCQMPVMGTTPCYRKFWVRNLRLVSLAWSPVCCHTCFLLVLPAPPPPEVTPGWSGPVSAPPHMAVLLFSFFFLQETCYFHLEAFKIFSLQEFSSKVPRGIFSHVILCICKCKSVYRLEKFSSMIYLLPLFDPFLSFLSFLLEHQLVIYQVSWIYLQSDLPFSSYFLSLYLCRDFEIPSPLFRPLSKILFPFNVFSMLGFKNHDFSCLLVWKRYSCFIDNSPKWKQKTLSEKWVD